MLCSLLGEVCLAVCLIQCGFLLYFTCTTHVQSTCALADVAGKAQLSKVAAQLLANMSANEGRALHAVWTACFPGAFADLAALPSEAHIALTNCCCWKRVFTGALRAQACDPSLQETCTGPCAGPCCTAAAPPQTTQQLCAARAGRQFCGGLCCQKPLRTMQRWLPQ